MIKRICAGTAAVIVLLACMCPFAVGGFNENEYNVVETESVTISEDYIPSETSKVEEEKTEVIILEPTVVERVETTDLEILSQKMSESATRKDGAHNMAEAARSLGYAEDNSIIVVAQIEWKNADADYKYYLETYTPLKKADDERKAEEERKRKEAEEKAAEAERKRKEEQQKAQKEQAKKEQTSTTTTVTKPTGTYDNATIIWNYMKGLGWNDAVCAGIMGNMMAEVGGNTLNINPYLYNPSGYYYGICQWNKSAYGKIHGASLEAQLDYLRDTIQYEMNTYGKKYGGYSGFLAITDAGYAAKAFAASYERCGGWGNRPNNAYVAYSYFVG
jgi:hypothetical protein